MKKIKILAVVMIAAIALAMAGCEDDNSSRKTEQLQQEQLQRESIAQSGVPDRLATRPAHQGLRR